MVASLPTFCSCSCTLYSLLTNRFVRDMWFRYCPSSGTISKGGFAEAVRKYLSEVEGFAPEDVAALVAEEYLAANVRGEEVRAIDLSGTWYYKY